MLQSTDIDECALANDNCAETAECNNTPGSFSCTCMAGYSGNGTFCEGIYSLHLALRSCLSDIDV